MLLFVIIVNFDEVLLLLELDGALLLIDNNLLLDFLLLRGDLLVHLFLDGSRGLLLLFNLLFHKFALFIDFLDQSLVLFLKLIVLLANLIIFRHALCVFSHLGLDLVQMRLKVCDD